ncbi:MAG: T9SS type B sorting domain-containing protein [Bacteroidales bacterium]|jgi:gliding motility-associated-like protein|nr:T9SS type B sorting domain-containing protein [Bacteroidales bacterium]
MKLKQKITKHIITFTITMIASVASTLADPIFNVYSNSHRNSTNGNYYLCDQDYTGDIQIMAANMESQVIGNINVEIYTNAADVGNISKAVKVYTNQRPSDITYTVDRSAINPTNIQKATQSYYVRITPADGSAGSWTEEITFDAIHVDDVTPPQIEPYCAGKMPASITTFITKYTKEMYHWYDANDNPLGFFDFLNVGNLTEGNHLYKLKVKNGNCYSKGIEIILPVMGNSAPRLNKSYVSYTPSDISGGTYTKTILEQAIALYGMELVDNPNNCDLIWRDKNGTVISNFDKYIPPVPTTYGATIDQYTVEKDCGCGSVSKATTIYVLEYIVPKPTVEDKVFCVGDTHASDGFDANIGLTSDAGESTDNYILEFSTNANMSDAISLPAGTMHFSYTFDVSAAGTTTYYVRQQQISSGEYSEIVPFEVIVQQPSAPVLTGQNVCANTTKSIELSSICNETGIIWKDADDNIITGNISTEKRGDITVNAQKYEIVNGEQCYSETVSTTIHTDSLDVLISGDNSLMPGQTGKAELAIRGSGNQTIAWSCDVSNSFVGDINKSEVKVKMETLDITLTAKVTDGACSQSADWTIQADLFKCPAPTADDINLCINDPRAANGFDANITLTDNTEEKSDYTLSVSTNSDMSGATTLSPGESHFNFQFDASVIGVKTIYIQQTELSRNLPSSIIPVKIIVSQPAIPSLHTTAICLNEITEIKLSDLSTVSNLQWYDGDKKELTTTAYFNKKGIHTLYAKQYEIVDGEKCWSEFASTSITADSIGIKIDGDNHLCPDGKGKVTIETSGTNHDNIQWKSDVSNTLSNTSSNTVNVEMSNSNLNLEYTVSAGVCQTNGAWEITVGSGIVSGEIKFTEGDKIKTSSTLKDVEFSSCGGKISVEATIEHTSSDFSVKKGSQDLGTYSFDGDVAKFEIEGDGTYSVVYGNDCETSFAFVVTTMSIQPTVSTTKWSSCYGGYIAAEISNVDGCEIVWKKDGTEIAKDTKVLKINNVSADDIGNYSYELICDGCPANGLVSSSQPDIYSPLTVTISQSADTICQKDEVEVNLEITPNSDKASFSWTTGNDITTSNAGASATLTPFFTKSYNVIIGNGDCDKQTKTINVNVQPQMNGNIEAGTIMCEGDSTTLDASGLNAERYEWKHTDSASAKITVVPNGVENIYTVTAYRGKCVLEKDFTLMVGATPKLASIDSIGLDDVIINMELTGDYLFIVDGKSTATDIADNVKKHVGFGDHSLSIIDIAGCKTDTSFTIAEPPFEIQNYIIPGSDGKNATFKIPDAVIVYGNTTMNIYDRWGKKLATLTSSDTEGWDGTYNGLPLPSTDYWYELSIDAIDKVYIGHFTLIRE